MPLHSTPALNPCTLPLHSTTSLFHCTLPLQSTTTLYHGTLPLQSTTLNLSCNLSYTQIYSKKIAGIQIFHFIFYLLPQTHGQPSPFVLLIRYKKGIFPIAENFFFFFENCNRNLHDIFCKFCTMLSKNNENSNERVDNTQSCSSVT